jgi:hypothetical protein
MTKQLTMGVLAGALGLMVGCGSNGTAAESSCISVEGLICQPAGLPFVTLAGASSDACAGSRLGTCQDPPLSATTASLTMSEAGRLCLSGTAAGSDGWAKIVLVFTQFNLERTKVLRVFDAEASGIAQVAFTVDSPPSGGVTIDAAVVTTRDCPAGPSGCFTQGFDLMTPSQPGMLATFTAPGPEVAPFSNFRQTLTGVSQVFDTSALQHLEFIVGPGVYNFCIHDLRFLDAAGNEVKEVKK